jgi:hypothetical protein
MMRMIVVFIMRLMVTIAVAAVVVCRSVPSKLWRSSIVVMRLRYIVSVIVGTVTIWLQVANAIILTTSLAYLLLRLL